MNRAAAIALVAILAASARADGPTAEELIPFEKLDVPIREELWRVTQRYTLRRAVPIQTVRAEEDDLAWVFDHLELASVVLRKLDLAPYRIEEDKDDRRRFSADDGGGAFAHCERVFAERGRLVFVARGFVEGPLLPRVHGTSVFVVRWHKETDDERAERERIDGKKSDSAARVVCDARIYFRVRDDFLHMATVPFRRILGKIVGDKVDGVIAVATKVCELIQRDPEKVWNALQGTSIAKEQLEAFRRRFLVH